MYSQKERSTNTSDYMTASQAEAKDQAVNYTKTFFVIAVSIERLSLSVSRECPLEMNLETLVLQNQMTKFSNWCLIQR